MLAWTIQSFQCSSSVPFENPGTTTRVSKQDENTPFYMLERLIELKVAITAAGVELELSSSNWALAKKLFK